MWCRIDPQTSDWTDKRMTEELKNDNAAKECGGERKGEVVGWDTQREGEMKLSEAKPGYLR